MTSDRPVTLQELFPDLPARGRRYTVEVSLRRDDDAGGTPAEDQAVFELAAVMLSARGLVTGFQSQQSVLSLVVDADDDADALASGVAVVRALGGCGGASVTVRPAV